METTTNYKLPQWVKADQIKISGGSFNVSIPKDYCEAGEESREKEE